MENVVIVSGVRTPIGAYGGTLKDLHVTKYAGLVLNEAVKRARIDPGQVDDVIMGQAAPLTRVMPIAFTSPL